MKNRSEIEEIYKWDIDLFKTSEDIEQVFKDIENLTQILPKFNGKFTDPDKFFEYFLNYKQESLRISKLSFYISNSLNIDSANTEMLKLSARFSNAYRKLSRATSFIGPQLDDLDEEYLKTLLKDSRAKDLDNTINDIIENKKHKLDEKTSQVISSLSRAFASSSAVFDLMTDSEMPFDDAVDCKGEKHFVNDAVYSQLITSEDRNLRQSALFSLMNGYGRFNKTLAELYIKDVESDTDFALLHNYNDVLENCLSAEHVPAIVYTNNIKNVEKNIPILQNFVKFLNIESNLNDFSYFDLFRKNKFEEKISIEQAQTIILKALAPMGKEYLEMVKRKFSDKSIDYMPCKNKNSGGYCSNNYDTKTLILMNWADNYDSMSTLAHEMGHCINAEYYNANQPQEKAGISIFAAEIASTVNEILLNQYMLKTCEPSKRKTYLKHFLNSVRSTIFRQTLFSEFELFVHEQIQNDVPLTYEDLNNKYFELNKKYYGDSCILPECLKFEWSRIPHFYNAYYVYSYSTGLISAISIANRILSDSSYAERYVEFLKNGVNKKSIDVLKDIDIDLTTNQPFDEAFKFISSQLDELKK